MKKWLLLGVCVLAFPLAAHAESNETNGNGAALTAQEETLTSTQNSDEVNTVASTEPTNEPSNTATSDSAAAVEPVVTTDSSSPQGTVSDKEAEDVQNKVVEDIEKDLGIKATEDVQETNLSAEQLRDNLYAIVGANLTKEEVDSYTDQQLLNAQTLFERYNYDTVGMDASSFARLLRALHKDNTLSYETASQALSFNPNNYQSSLDLIPVVDQLQAYLKAMYPANSSFWGVRSLTNDELIAILKHIAPVQQKIIEQRGYLWPGMIALISNYAEKGIPATEDSTQQTQESSTAESTTTSSTKQAAATTPSSSESQNIVQKLLPKTGEQRTIWMVVIGLIIVGIVAYVWLRKSRSRH